ncbi:MAG: TIGR01458 family HAD-type hydrolase [Acidobacteria bacterium]|nr:TIGR01458 family HAD-type hydrolase [Acidobacteriota bacterium]
MQTSPLARARGVLFDMDGVLYNAEQPIAGAAEAMAWVRAQGIPRLFVTNTTSRSRAVLAEKLARFGIAGGEEDILTPPVAAAEWLRAHAAGGAVAVFVRPATRAEFAGLDLLDDEAERGAAYVVIGDLGTHWDFRTLNRAFRLLHHNPEARLIALGMTRYWLAADGISLDVAPFVAALEHAAGRKAMVFGKPAANFFHAAAARLSLAPEEVLMVGDDVEADVRGAMAAGLAGALVRTGKFRDADLEGAPHPDLVIDSVADLAAAWNYRYFTNRTALPRSL